MVDANISKAAYAEALKNLGLFTRLPALFVSRGWSTNDSLLVVSAVAVASCSMGKGERALKVPNSAVDYIEWSFAVEPLTQIGATLTANEIVDKLNLQPLLDL